MKNHIIKYITSLSAILLLYNCKTMHGNSVIGTWKLSEKLVDENTYTSHSKSTPQKITSTRIITFDSNSTFTSNGDICSSGTDTLNPSNGKYNKYKNKDGYYILQPNKCIGVSGSNILMRVEDKRLYIEYPSVGYNYQIFDKQK